MLLHIGDDVVVGLKELIAIIDADLVRSSPAHQRMIRTKYGKNSLERLLQEGVKSVVITDGGVYPSPISSMTLKRRVETGAVESPME